MSGPRGRLCWISISPGGAVVRVNVVCASMLAKDLNDASLFFLYFVLRSVPIVRRSFGCAVGHEKLFRRLEEEDGFS